MASVKKKIQSQKYERFDLIDGSHTLKQAVPESYIEYPARIRRGGKVAYFNFTLAKEMGLIDHDHDEVLTSELEEKVYDTFSIQIINEYDQLKNRVFKKEDMKPGTYMATRYLQMQHDDKKGLNSGDGRSVWLGEISHGKKSWDISGCGTGATRLSPATSKFNKFFETGDPSISYGCGYGELDEGIATSIMSYIFNENHIATEETLCVIEFKNNISINIRASHDLLRPSHFFLYLKQDNYKSLKKIIDYYIDRSRYKPGWEKCPKGKGKYRFLLNRVVQDFSKVSANFEDDYIFCWLDWDGDNILMDGGIIDYGSIRKFGIMHHEYKYDDVERYSTSLLEQKGKAKYMVQTFIQIVDYLETKEKKGITEFSDHRCLEDFEKCYTEFKNLNILRKLGFSKVKAKQVLRREKKLVEDFRKVYSYFERAKSKTGMIKVSDGITCDAIFNMGNILRELPQLMLSEQKFLDEDAFIDIIKAAFATEEDLVNSPYRASKCREFQELYLKLAEKCSKYFQEDLEDTLLQMTKFSGLVNKPNKITGDAVTHIVDLLRREKSKLGPEKLHQLIKDISFYQKEVGFDVPSENRKPSPILRKILNIIKENREGI